MSIQRFKRWHLYVSLSGSVYIFLGYMSEHGNFDCVLWDVNRQSIWYAYEDDLTSIRHSKYQSFAYRLHCLRHFNHVKYKKLARDLQDVPRKKPGWYAV